MVVRAVSEEQLFPADDRRPNPTNITKSVCANISWPGVVPLEKIVTLRTEKPNSDPIPAATIVDNTPTPRVVEEG